MVATLALARGALSLAACSNAQLVGPTGGADASEPADACSTAPRLVCGANPGAGRCVGDPSSPNASVRKIPADASVPVGCTLNVPDPVPNEFGECLVDVACECTDGLVDAGADAAPTPWVCKS